MSRLRVHNFAISLDGYGAGPRQDRENPLGVGGAGMDLPASGHACTQHVGTPAATHVVLTRNADQLTT